MLYPVKYFGRARNLLNVGCHKHVIDACNNALKRLQLDYLDLYFCHRPDPETPIEETVRAMHTLVITKFVIKLPNGLANQIEEAYKISKDLNLTPPSMEQPQYNMFERKNGKRIYLYF